MMNIVFFGTSEFAVPSLEAVYKSRHKISSVITQQKRQTKRGLRFLPSPIEEAAAALGLKVKIFEDINSKQAEGFLKSLNANLFIVVAFGQVLSPLILKIPTLYCINIHGSLLPKYRGAAPIQWSIINGEKVTGISIIRMNEFLDKGDIIVQRQVEIDDNDNFLSLNKKLSLVSAELLVETLNKVEANETEFILQDESLASYAPKLKKEDGLIDWKKDATSIRNLVRGCYPWPSVYTYLNGKLLKILEADISNIREDVVTGSVIRSDNNGLLVVCKYGSILIKRLQIEGKNALSAGEFLRGKPVKKGVVLG